ncbi:MAG: DUF305 domain-containing protein [Acidimicrobiales bacterium]|nr:DUF305 domain-containing protein [Acidimicrobiales bacterium]GJM36697.1 MAG: hypothetical protein DHS20C19_00640 [Acidimicrobiales bacterium]
MTTTDVDRSDASPPALDHEARVSGLRRLLPTTPGQRMVGVIALMFLAGSIGYFIGVREGDSPPGDSADVGFLYDMSAHHEQAVQLSMIQLANGSEPSVHAFAREIIRSQSYEIGLMQMRLGMWGFDPASREQEPMAWMGMSVPSTDAMPGMADAAELETFRDAQGPETDALFLALMSDHHAGGVAMAQDAASRAEDAWVVDTAERMARIQASEIAEMEFAREAAGLPSSPAGFVADFGPDAADMGEMDMDPSQSDMDNDDGG